MDFAKYQTKVEETAVEANDGEQLVLNALCIAGKAGELANLVKKIVWHLYDFDEKRIQELLGDILRYITNLSNAFGWSLDDIASKNLEKLHRRHPNDVNTK